MNAVQEGMQVSLRWYVVHAYSNFEHKVAESLKERVKRQGLDAKFGEILVPTEEVVEMRDGQKRKSDRKFFPQTISANSKRTDFALAA
jgi:transcriptional antiterminator NusG